MTHSTDAFRAMTAEECRALLEEMRRELRPLYKRIEREAAETLRLRPIYLGRQPFPKRSEMIRRAMSLRTNEESAAEILAVFFMERYGDEVAELLDALGVEHEEGALREMSPAQPDEKKLREVVQRFRAGKDPVMRGVLLKAFAAQSAIDWPALEALVLFGEGAGAES